MFLELSICLYFDGVCFFSIIPFLKGTELYLIKGIFPFREKRSAVFLRNGAPYIAI